MIPRKFSLKTLRKNHAQPSAAMGFMGGTHGAVAATARLGIPKPVLKVAGAVLGLCILVFVGVALSMGVAPTPQTVTVALEQK